MKRAWLITWEGTSEKILDQNRIAAIISAKRSSAFVKDLCDVLYNRTIFDLSDAIRFANRKAERMRLSQTLEGGAIAFGHNPFLFARVISEISIKKKGDSETLSWKEPDQYGFDEKHHIVLKHKGGRDQLTRKRHEPISKEIFLA